MPRQPWRSLQRATSITRWAYDGPSRSATWGQVEKTSSARWAWSLCIAIVRSIRAGVRRPDAILLGSPRSTANHIPWPRGCCASAAADAPAQRCTSRFPEALNLQWGSSMIVGIGLDIVETERFARALGPAEGQGRFVE